jgi:hypothetical protein
MQKIALILGLALVAHNAALAQSSVTLDGTSGTNTISTDLSTTGGLTVSLGFFADYLIVGGGGGGGGGGYFGGGGGGGAGGFLTGSLLLSDPSSTIGLVGVG